jgi:hypothetical protein
MADVTVSGNVKYGVTLGPNVDPASDGELKSSEKQEATFTITGKPDENNTATIKIKVQELWNIVTDSETLTIDPELTEDIVIDLSQGVNAEKILDKALFESYLLKSFGITDVPLTLKLSGGYFEVGNADVAKMSGYECEDVTNTKLKEWQLAVDAKIMDMVTVRVGVDPELTYQDGPEIDDASVGYVIGVFGGVDPVDVELFYTNKDAAFEQSGKMAAGIAGDLAFGDIGLKAGISLGMDLAEAPAKPMELGIALKLTYASMLMLGVGTYGYTVDPDSGADDAIVDIIGVNVEYTGVDNLTLFIGAKIGLTEDNYGDDALRLLDIGLKTKAGALEIVLGYQLRPETASDSDPGKEDKYAYTTNSASGGVFMGMNLAY